MKSSGWPSRMAWRTRRSVFDLQFGVRHHFLGDGFDVDRLDESLTDEAPARRVGNADQVVAASHPAGLAFGFQDADDGERDFPDADDLADRVVGVKEILPDLDAQDADLFPGLKLLFVEERPFLYLPFPDFGIFFAYALDVRPPVFISVNHLNGRVDVRRRPRDRGAFAPRWPRRHPASDSTGHRIPSGHRPCSRFPDGQRGGSSPWH